MKLTLKIKLLPMAEQRSFLLDTIREANAACNLISEIAWENRVFNQFRLHHLCYNDIRERFRLSAQMVVRCVRKVADAYKLDHKCRREFRPGGSITYDSRILSYKGETASVWTTGKRQRISVACHNKTYMAHTKGEADLVYRKGKFFLYQAIELPDVEVTETENFVGLDFGITDIVSDSDGKSYSSANLLEYRKKRRKIRGAIQSKGTKGKTRACKRGCARLLKRLKGKEHTTATIINHTISKQIVSDAKRRGIGVAIEDLTNIRKNPKRRNKTFRTELGAWSFRQLRSFLEYKCRREGVRLITVQSAYTSQTCHKCHHIGIRNGKSFKCPHCGCDMDADVNAAMNIALLGVVVNQPEKSSMYSCSLH